MRIHHVVCVLSFLPIHLACDLTDPGCTSDTECREGRVCFEQACAWPGGVSPNNGENNGGNNGENNGVANNGANNGVANNGVANNGANNGAANNGGPGNNGVEPVNNGVEPVNNTIFWNLYGCDEIVQNGLATGSGFYTIARPDGREREIYCYMDDGDGWTLVARTAEGGEGEFGWGVDRGSVRDPGVYALSITEWPVRFTEVLVATQNDSDDPNAFDVNGPVYVVRPIPGNFYESRFDRGTTSLNVERIDGPCPEAPSLNYWGYTFLNDHYFVGADLALLETGLYPDGFQFVPIQEPCFDGELTGQQGLLFVR